MLRFTCASFCTGITWGWARSTESDAKPYICEIERSDVYKIMGEDRTFG